MTHKSKFHFPACMCLMLCFLTISTHQDVLWFPDACFMVSRIMFHGFQLHIYGFQRHVLWFLGSCFMVPVACMPVLELIGLPLMFYGFQRHVLWFPGSCFMVSRIMFYGFQLWVYSGVICDYMNSPSFQQALAEKCRIYLDQGRVPYTLSFLKLLTLLGYSGPDTKAFQKSLKDAYEQWKQL
ncbi:hypothetical protein C8J56DRAFT_900727 [Mycena floridula]|nr:hypothetical protein C8J56DRAFT_900727 [Mycena floridula]